MGDSPEISALATGGSVDLVMDLVGLSGNVVEWRTVSFPGSEPRNVRPRSCRGLASRGRLCRGISDTPEKGLRNRGFVMDGSNPAGRTFFYGVSAR
jgi:hypothetical protein